MRNAEQSLAPVRRLGVFLPRWVGDVVMATPTLRALRQHFGPEVHLTGILKPYLRDVLDGTPWLDDYVLHDPQSGRSEQRGWGLVKRLRRWRFDALLVLPNWPRTALLARLAGAPIRAGYVRLGHPLLLTHTARPPQHAGRRVPQSAVDAYAHLAELLGCPVVDRRVELALTPQQRQLADDAWSALRIHPEQPVIALNTGGAYGAAKRWPDRHFAHLAAQLVDHFAAQVLVVCGPAEREAAENIAQLAGRAAVKTLAARPPSIGLTKGCLARCSLLVTTDSGPRHLAAGLRTPTMTLFGPTDPRWSSNYAPLGLELQQPVLCGPCARRTCPLVHHQCMEDLTPRRVLQALNRWWPTLQRKRAG